MGRGLLPVSRMIIRRMAWKALGNWFRPFECFSDTAVAVVVEHSEIFRPKVPIDENVFTSQHVMIGAIRTAALCRTPYGKLLGLRSEYRGRDRRPLFMEEFSGLMCRLLLVSAQLETARNEADSARDHHALRCRALRGVPNASIRAC